MSVHFSFPETHWPVAESVNPLLPPVIEFGHYPELPTPVPEALGGALTATFLILITTREGEGIVGWGEEWKDSRSPISRQIGKMGEAATFFAISHCATSKWAKLANNEKNFLRRSKHWEHSGHTCCPIVNSLSKTILDLCWRMTGTGRMTICRHSASESLQQIWMAMKIW